MEDAPKPPARPLLRIVVALVGVLAVVLLLRLVRWSESDVSPTPGGQYAVLVIDDGDSLPREFEVPIGEGATVLSVLEAVDDLEVQRRGEFVTAIGGKANEGADMRNWLYSINGERGNVGAGSRSVQGGDRVLWQLAPYE